MRLLNWTFQLFFKVIGPEMLALWKHLPHRIFPEVQTKLPSLGLPLLDQACLLLSVSPSINASTLHYLVLGSRELPLLGPSISCGPWEEVGWEAVGSDRQSGLRPSIPLSLGITLPFFWCKGYWENWITSSLFLGIGASQKWILGSFMGA